MINKCLLYYNTIKYMKPGQLFYRLAKKTGLNCTIGCLPNLQFTKPKIIKTPIELDMDDVYLSRYNAKEIVSDKITFLNVSKDFDWNEKWTFDDQSDLWNFNLHYFDYLFSLVDEYKKTNDRKYFDKTIYCIESWIDKNPVGTGIGWSPYTIDLRLTNWISYYCIMYDEFVEEFKIKIEKSMHDQFVYLSKHIEKDILGNHYFEDLKTLILCSIFFNDNNMLHKALIEFKKECKEEILTDGMHFELSIMYHKIIFEGLLRITIALRGIGEPDNELERLISPMLDVAWSFEEGIERIPLFNDCGDNVAKSLKALQSVCEKYFEITPKFKAEFPYGGFYIYKDDNYKLIVDAGEIGPEYIPGHSHCDAMSFELYKNGKPVITNCGTYGYQCKERQYFRSTAAHNTVMINDTEQSQCWSVFRVAKRSKIKIIEKNESFIKIELEDYRRNIVYRTISITDKDIKIRDYSKGNQLSSYYHLLSDDISLYSECKMTESIQKYAPEYGICKNIRTCCFNEKNFVEVIIHVGD